MKLASAPVSWGVWEQTTGRDDLVPADLLLETVRGLGYDAIELGPPGYLSPVALEAHGLALVGGFAPLRFEEETRYAEDVGLWLDPIVEVLLATGAHGPVVLAGAHTGGEPSPGYFERVNEAADRVRARGLGVVFHHHAGTAIETPAQLEALLAHTDVGICFDTGHALVGGGDPVDVARMCGGRIEHLHLKDVDSSLLARLHAGEVPLHQAWADGIFCPFGDGAVDFAAVLALPGLAGYAGWTVLEQDRVAVRPEDVPAVRAVEERNLAFVRKLAA
ncbi:MAG: sugar phosphate isomerase/epimerase family protein [Gaiellaceae bacterium]